MLIGINGGYFPAICRVCLRVESQVKELQRLVAPFNRPDTTSTNDTKKNKSLIKRNTSLNFGENTKYEPLSTIASSLQ